MRDFSRTSEPSGAPGRGGRRTPRGGRSGRSRGNSFVIQQHAARRMHYDFRLELDGVLLSWSVPKGPSLSPTERRLAVRTEDHPLAYASFEGIIPQGQYGGGTVSVWDRGTWSPDGSTTDPREALAKGRLTFTLQGEKLRGRWHLVRTRGDGKAENWLLFKGRDEAANDEVDITRSEPASVLSGRTVDEIAAAADRVWQSNRAGTPTVAEKRAAKIAAARPAPSGAAANHNARDQVASLVAQLPVGFALTNLDKVLYPDQGITKGELIAYLAVVAEWAMPHLAGRPLMIMRCPDGIRAAHGRARSCFYQKHVLPGSPDAIGVVHVVETDGEAVDYMQVHDMAGLVALAQLGTLEIHTWGCHASHIESPDLMVFDLDPDVGLGWDRVALAAFELRRRLGEAGLASFVKTTGGKGLHVVVPVSRGTGWDDFKAFSKAAVEQMERDEPGQYTTNMAKAQRKGKIFLDYLRNGRGATFIAPYSPRARPGATVAVPITWDELAHGVDPAEFTTVTVPRRLAALREDPWRDLRGLRQSITKAAWRAIGGEPGGAPGGKMRGPGSPKRKR